MTQSDDDTKKRDKTIKIALFVSFGVLVLLVIAALFYFAKPAAWGYDYGYAKKEPTIGDWTKNENPYKIQTYYG